MGADYNVVTCATMENDDGRGAHSPAFWPILHGPDRPDKRDRVPHSHPRGWSKHLLRLRRTKPRSAKRQHHLITYRFRVRDSKESPWRMARDKMTLEHVRAVYGDGNYEKIDGTQEVREQPSIKLFELHKTPTK